MMSSHLGELSGNRPAFSRLAHPQPLTQPPLGLRNAGNNGLLTTHSTDLQIRQQTWKRTVNADSNSSVGRRAKTIHTATEAPHRDIVVPDLPVMSPSATIQPSSRNHSKRSLPVTRSTNSTGPGFIYMSMLPSAVQSPVTATYQALCRAPFANPLLSEFAR